MKKLKNSKKRPLSIGKTLGGKGHFPDKMINKLSNYFGVAIRQCVGKTVFEMKKAIGCIFVSLFRSIKF